MSDSFSQVHLYWVTLRLPLLAPRIIRVCTKAVHGHNAVKVLDVRTAVWIVFRTRQHCSHFHDRPHIHLLCLRHLALVGVEEAQIVNGVQRRRVLRSPRLLVSS